MYIKELLVLAFTKKEWNTVAYIVIGYYAEYEEEDIDGARDKFYTYFELLPVEALKCMQEQLVDLGFFHLDHMIETRIKKICT